MTSRPLVTLRSERLEASLALTGAELWSLVWEGEERLWHGDPEWWDYRAPLLFPVIGRSIDETVTVDGRPYPMPLHGFARDRAFALTGSADGRVSLAQESDDQTHGMFPFDYRLAVDAWVDGDTLGMTTTVENRSSRPMPFCFGYHPGFLWAATRNEREAFVCRFGHREDAPVRRARLATGLLLRERETCPVGGRTLALRDDLFERGSIQFETLRSRAVWFGRPGGCGITVTFPDCPHLGIWTRPGAPFLCIEPWHGFAAEEGGSPELSQRPGVVSLPPGQTAAFPLTIAFGTDDPGA
ncbi:aldose 1-epimerase family protein [Alsobacter sp. R-9]